MKNNNSNTSLKRGRPPKKDYDPEALMRELIDTATEIYQKREIKATALELDLPPGKVKKLLITGNVLSYPETKQIQDLMQQGKSMAEIQHMMGLSYSTLHTYLPYTKVIYKMSEISQNAKRVKAYKARKSAVDTLMAAPTEETSLGLRCCLSKLSVLYRVRLAFFLYTEEGEEWGIFKGVVH